LRGARRDAVNKDGDSCSKIAKKDPELGQNMLNEILEMLIEPKYLECFMVKTPLVPLKKNHAT
jgi:hypothetical protein